MPYKSHKPPAVKAPIKPPPTPKAPKGLGKEDQMFIKRMKGGK